MDTRLFIRISRTDKEKIEKFLQQKDISLSDFVREKIMQEIEQQKKEQITSK